MFLFQKSKTLLIQISSRSKYAESHGSHLQFYERHTSPYSNTLSVPQSTRQRCLWMHMTVNTSSNGCKASGTTITPAPFPPHDQTYQYIELLEVPWTALPS